MALIGSRPGTSTLADRNFPQQASRPDGCESSKDKIRCPPILSYRKNPPITLGVKPGKGNRVRVFLSGRNSP